MLGGIGKDVDIKGISYNDDATLDEKSRVLLPRKVRERLGESFTLAVGIYGGLIAVPQVVWKLIEQEVRRAPILNPDRMYFSSQFMGATEDEVNFDSQGRFVIPTRLRGPANLELKKPVFLNGADIWLEIWSPDDFASYSKDPIAFGGERTQKLLDAYKRMQDSIREAA